MDRFIGKIIDNKYLIQALIGVGGMAEVYKALDLSTNTVVAIKFLKQEFISDEDAIKRFKTESKAISLMRHDNIVKVFDVHISEKLQYIVMEFIDGIPLKKYIEQEKTISWKETLFFVTQILDALEHAHENKVVHRDIKPQNILLINDGSIKVADFGIARFSGSETKSMTNKAIGSVHYISPEQVTGGKVDYRSDIYSVGVMMYEMLSGKLPFDAENPVSVALMQLQKSPQNIKDINSDIPDGLAEIVMKAMCKDPEQRYQSAKDMLKDIAIFKTNPSIVFQYKYFVDQQPTKYIDAINLEKSNRDKEEEIPSGKKFATVLSGIGAALGIFLIIGFIFYKILFPGNNPVAPKEVQVPNFVGQNYNLISTDPKYANIRFLPTYVEDASKKVGEIISQSPEKGTIIKEGSDVRITVVKDANKYTVPNLINQNIRVVEVQLKADRVNYKIIREYSDNVALDYIIRTDPIPGEEISYSTEIKVYVSDGKEKKKVIMPNLEGLTEDQAKALIVQNGLIVGSITEVDSDQPKGNIVYQSVPKNSEVLEGSVVDLKKSSGVKVVKTKVVNIPFNNDLPDTFVLKVVLDGTTVHEETHEKSEGSVDVTLKSTNATGTLELFIDDVLNNTVTVTFE